MTATTTPPNPPKIEQVPTEILQKIAYFSHPHDVIKLKHVSHTLRYKSSLFIESHAFSKLHLENMITHCYQMIYPKPNTTINTNSSESSTDHVDDNYDEKRSVADSEIAILNTISWPNIGLPYLEALIALKGFKYIYNANLNGLPGNHSQVTYEAQRLMTTALLSALDNNIITDKEHLKEIVFWACEENSVALMKKCIASRQPENDISDTISASTSFTTMADILTSDRYFVFRMACQSNYVGMAKVLLSTDLFHPSFNDYEVIRLAAERGHEDMLLLLVTHFTTSAELQAKNVPLVDMDLLQCLDHILLRTACQYGMSLLLDFLIEHKVPLHLDDNQALLLACQYGHPSTLFLHTSTRDKDPRHLSATHETPASLKHATTIVSTLLGTGKVTPTPECLAVASEHGRHSIVSCLLNHEPKTLDPSAHDDEALRIACRNGHTLVVKRLLDTGKCHPAVYDQRCLNVAAVYGYKDIVGLLLGTGRVNPLANDKMAWRIAAKKGFFDIVDILETYSKAVYGVSINDM